jgi:hypothetical protein
MVQLNLHSLEPRPHLQAYSLALMSGWLLQGWLQGGGSCSCTRHYRPNCNISDHWWHWHSFS